MLDFFTRHLRFPRALWLSSALALLLAAPSVAAAFYCDDALFVARLEGALPSPRPGPLSLYTLAVGGPENLSPFWWASPALRISFLRPLASALLSLDHALFGRLAAPYHVHSLVWFTAAVALAAVVYRKLLSERTGALAALLFAVSPLHAMVANWPAARHVAVAGALGFLALLLHVRARAASRAPVAAVAVLLVALATSEAALGVFGYLLTYELFGRDDTRRDKARSLAPYAVVGGAYLVVYRALGAGVRASGDYADPLASPWAFLRNVPRHLGPLASSTFFGVPSESSVAFPALVLPMILVGSAAALAFGLLLGRALSLAAEGDRRAIRWLLPGALLAILPGLAGIVGDRALVLPSLGLSAAIAVAIANGARRDTEGRRPVIARLGTAALVALQLVLAPLSFVAQTASFVTSSRAAAAVVARADFLRDPSAEVFGIGIADPLIGMYLQPALVVAGGPALEVTMLTASLHDHVVRRRDDRTLEITIVGGSLLESGFETVVRPRSEPFRVDDAVALGRATIRVLDEVRGSPTRFAVMFDRSASDPSLVLIVWSHGALMRLAPPEVGESITLRHEKGPVGF